MNRLNIAPSPRESRRLEEADEADVEIEESDDEEEDAEGIEDLKA